MTPNRVFCKYYQKNKCKKGAHCKFSHREEDSPECKKAIRDTQLQLTLICLLCAAPVIRTGKWFGLLAGCRHVFCYQCLQNKKKDKTSKKGCPECGIPIETFAPSGLFMTRVIERENWISYFEKHEESIMKAYSEKNNRVRKCGFHPCTKRITLPDGTIRCIHGEFNQKEQEASEQERKARELRLQRIRENAQWLKNKLAVKKLFPSLPSFLTIGLIYIFYFLCSFLMTFQLPSEPVLVLHVALPVTPDFPINNQNLPYCILFEENTNELPFSFP